MNLQVALHEAAHTLGRLAAGQRVDRVFFDGIGGAVEGEPCPDPDREIIASLAGDAASSMLGDGSCPASPSDKEFADHAFTELLGYPPNDRQRRAAMDQARGFVYCNTDAIEWLADRLLARRSLSAQDIGVLCREPRSPLAKYQGLYPQSKPAPRGALAMLGMHGGRYDAWYRAAAAAERE